MSISVYYYVLKVLIIVALRVNSRPMSSALQRQGLKLMTTLFLPYALQFSSLPTGTLGSQAVPAAYASDYEFKDLRRLSRGLKEVSYLLDHWEEKTTYCNFGEVKTEMMDAKNKEMLLIAASEPGLFDKSKTMNVRCKRDPEVVRAFVGLTKENTVLQRAEALMRDKNTLSRVDPDRIDEYIECVERYSRSVSSVDSLAYNARTDFASTNTFSLSSSADSQAGSNYIEQSKASVLDVRDSLAAIVDILGI
jgi:hypothetical protein